LCIARLEGIHFVPRRPVDPNRDLDRLRDKVAQGLRAAQAMPFLRPYLDLRRAELLVALKAYADNSNKDKVLETAIRISEVETILIQMQADTRAGQSAGARITGGRG